MVDVSFLSQERHSRFCCVSQVVGFWIHPGCKTSSSSSCSGLDLRAEIMSRNFQASNSLTVTKCPQISRGLTLDVKDFEKSRRQVLKIGAPSIFRGNSLFCLGNTILPEYIPFLRHQNFCTPSRREVSNPLKEGRTESETTELSHQNKHSWLV